MGKLTGSLVAHLVEEDLRRGVAHHVVEALLRAVEVHFLYLNQVGLGRGHGRPGDLERVGRRLDELHLARRAWYIGFKEPQIFTTNLVVPSFSVAVATAPNIQSIVDGN